ncbi:MAG: DUF1461 domain-containing protein [Clostridia bacterium]|nr:DUF1461 domain-containing protein [Clostridia bacterium]
MIRRILSFAAGLFWSAAALLLTVYLLCAAPGVMTKAMRAVAPEAETGLPDAEYPGVCGVICGYLTGKTDTFQYAFTDDAGVERLCFNSTEQLHMEDCRGLIALDGTLCLICVSAGLGLSLMCLRRKTLRAWRFGLLFPLLPVAAAVIWAAIDFTGLFFLFHRLAFTNELWLLDWRTCLLIRLMPEELFIFYGIAGVLMWFILLAAAMLVTGKVRYRNENSRA